MCEKARRGDLGEQDPNRISGHRKAVTGSLLTVVILCLSFACGGGDSQVSAVSPSVSPQIALVPRFSGLTAPLAVTHAGDNTGNLYVVEQAGRIRVIDNSTLLPTPFLDISARVLSGGRAGPPGARLPAGVRDNGAVLRELHESPGREHRDRAFSSNRQPRLGGS